MLIMTDISLRLKNELRRLIAGPSPDEKPGGMGIVRFQVNSAAAEDVLRRAKQVLRVIDNATLDGWPSTEGLVPQLPEWFRSVHAPQMSREQADAWLAKWKRLSPDEQAEEEITRQWSLENWLYWFEPANRQWFWWDAQAQNEGLVLLAFEVDGWPFPWGSLRWLFRAAGASAMEAEQLGN